MFQNNLRSFFTCNENQASVMFIECIMVLFVYLNFVEKWMGGFSFMILCVYGAVLWDYVTLAMRFC